MKRLLISGLLVALASTAAFAAPVEDGTNEEKEVKKGWSFGVLPCATYSNDMGFQYGAFGDVYYYGDGNTYPDPLHKISWEVSHYTKGRSRYYLSYDSKYLIPKLRVTASATYITDPLYNFWGFNGGASPYYADLVSNKDYYNGNYDALNYVNYVTMGVSANGNQGISYYHMKRNMLRLLADFQYKLSPSLRLVGGVSYWKFDTGYLNNEKYGYDPKSTMYQHYINYGLIEENEKDGGNRLELKAGLVFDTRDMEAAPNKGIWSEIYLNGSPDVFGDGYNYLKLCAHWRHYIRIPVGFIKAGDPVFAYHLAYQGTIAGNAPFYVQQNINALILKQMVSEGLGSSNTIRGTFNNRIIADGYAWANFELRVKLVNFKLFGQYFYIATNPFFDCGLITQPYRFDKMASLPDIAAIAVTNGYSNASEYLRAKSSEFVKSAGIGLKIAWNQNFIVSAEAAHNFNTGLGDPFWLSIGVNYLF